MRRSGLFAATAILMALTATSAHADAVFMGLGDLEGGNFFSQANAVSADGSVVVGTGVSASFEEAFRWTDAGMVGLGGLTGGNNFFGSRATGVSADGSVVVGRGSSASGSEAFIWDEDAGMRSLQQLLIAEYGLELSLMDWILSEATGISADGRSIVGYGTNPDGDREAWLVRLGEPGNGVAPIPEPTPLAVLAVAALAALGARHRRRAA